MLSETLTKILPLAGQLKTHVNAEVEAHIKSPLADMSSDHKPFQAVQESRTQCSAKALAPGLISYRKSSGARKGLASTFNFAPFYLEALLGQLGAKFSGLPWRRAQSQEVGAIRESSPEREG